MDFYPDQNNAEHDQPNAGHDPSNAELDYHDAEHEDPDYPEGGFTGSTNDVINHNVNVFVHDGGGAVHDDVTDEEPRHRKEGITCKQNEYDGYYGASCRISKLLVKFRITIIVDENTKQSTLLEAKIKMVSTSIIRSRYKKINHSHLNHKQVIQSITTT